MRCLSLFALLVTSLLLTGCESDLINNPSFDRWCGEQLCDWTTDEGTIARVGSWHEQDYAVSFVDAPTRISQLSKHSAPGECIRFDLIADVDPLAQVLFLVDFDDDGAIEVTQHVPAANWATTSFVIPSPSWSTSVRYAFEKTGKGRAVLAQIWAADLTAGCASDAGLPR